MFNTIIQATENFCRHQIAQEYELTKELTDKRTLIAYIDIETQSDLTYRVYISSDLGFMQKVSKLFLEEDESDEETLIDMTLETANLIIGSAKVIAEEKNENPYTIKTPHFVKVDMFDLEYDDLQVFKIENETITVAIKEIDAN
jgi:hypothetical protein